MLRIRPQLRFTLAITVLTFAPVGLPAVAQTYPAKPIRVVAPAAGGTSDILARLIGVKLTEAWGQRVIVDNRPGANGNIAAELVVHSAPDGYTMLFQDVGNMAVTATLYRVPYDLLKDFSPITNISYSPHAFSVHPSLPVRTVKDLIALAKSRPGQLNAAANLGSAAHLATMLFAHRSGVNWMYLPVSHSAVTSVVMGEGHALFIGMMQALPHVKSGRLRLLALSSARRDPALPDVPTVGETPGLEGFITGSWQGLMAPANTPPQVVNKVNLEVARILKTQEIREKLAAQATVSQANTPGEMSQWLAAERNRWAEFVKATGYKLE